MKTAQQKRRYIVEVTTTTDISDVADFESADDLLRWMTDFFAQFPGAATAKVPWLISIDNVEPE